MRYPNATSRTPRSPGFTLVELLVAVGVVILLSIGIGQLFGNVSRLVSTGSAVAEVDALARAMEKQIRDDFDRMSALPTDETLLAIRSRIVRNVYLTSEDEQSDRRANLAPGAPGSLARSTRLDEVLFLAEAGGNALFQTAQEAGNENLANPTPSASVARILYGHGLKPVLDPNYNPDPDDIDFDTADPASDALYRQRIWYADGDFGSGPTAEGNTFNRFSPNNERSTGRNQFSGDFSLARHELLLAGGLAFSYAEPGTGSITGRNRSIAMYVRDLDTLRFNAISASVFENPNQNTGPFFRVPAFQNFDVPRIGLIRHGRVDICAQSPESLRRWLEGVEARETASTGVPPPLPPDATPFDSGFFDQGAEEWRPNAFAVADRPLWVRRTFRRGQVTPPGVSPGLVRQYNTTRLHSAIAGMFNRIMVETEPTTIRRVIPADNVDERPEHTLMDYHAVIASRCSRFEVYWSDGTRWRGADSPPKNLSGDGSYVVTYSDGDIMWFGFGDPRENYPPLATIVSPEIPRNTRNSRLVSTEDGLNQIGLEAAYDINRTAAALDLRDEYLAIWGYRVPGTSGRYEPGGWAKPKLLKFRMTLHDSQFRLREGKTFEFIVEIDNQRQN
ncbi:MAG: type II secretion system protein J [Phycisphaerales bacterium]